MDKRLKTGLLLMLAAVVLMPVAFLFKNSGQAVVIGVIVFTMLLEILGLIFVILSLFKSKNQGK